MPEDPQRDSTWARDVPAEPPSFVERAPIFRAVAAIIPPAALICFACLLGFPAPDQDRRVQAMLAGGLLVSIALVLLLQWLRWARPARKLARLLPLVRAGEAAIDELSEVRGGLAAIVRQVQGTLRDLRRQRTHVAELELETSQRVANRTDALERSMGALRQQATRDPLTGLYNRRILDTTLQRLVEDCRSNGDSLSLMMIDIDDFKLLNDTCGHAAGDEFLRSLGQLIKSTVRGNDVPFRYGGDEFVILLPATDRQRAGRVVQRLTSLADALARTIHTPRPPRLSIGLVSIDETPPDALLAGADRLLYQGKVARKKAEHSRMARESTKLVATKRAG